MCESVPDVIIEINDSDSPPHQSDETIAPSNEVLKILEEGSQKSGSQDSLVSFEPRILRHTKNRPTSSNMSAPKPKKRKITSTTKKIVDNYLDSDDSFETGNEIVEPILELNDEFSVFLSSQMICQVTQKVEESKKVQVPFTYAAKSSSASSNQIEVKNCFHSSIKRVYVRNGEIEFIINMRQFNLYHLSVTGDQNIKNFLRLSEKQFESFKYFFDRIPNLNLECKRKLFALFIEHYKNFNTFSFSLNDQEVTVQPPVATSRCHKNLQSAIDPQIVQKMRLLKLKSK